MPTSSEQSHSEQSHSEQFYSEQLAQILHKIQHPGNFYSSGTVEIHPINLTVKGVGAIALPLLPAQAEQLITVAEQAPYGQGTETFTDTTVRRTWQIDAERVSITGKQWKVHLAAMVKQAAVGLGVEQAVSAKLYKLLVYENECFFTEHRDTEKAPGMFATMVVVLPSNYQGGALTLRHHGQEVALDLQREDPSEAAFAAFYADCRHQVHPIISGHRLTLIYNLIRRDKGKKLPMAPDHSEAQQQLTTFLQQWSSSKDSPAKLIFPLEHAYTKSSIGLRFLKGADAAKGKILAAAAKVADCDASAALLRIEDSGSAEHDGGGYSRWGYDSDDDDFSIVEICDYSAAISDWRFLASRTLKLGDLPFLTEEISPPNALDDIEPSELEFSEATGNEGASFERLYALGVLAVWPKNRRMEVIAQGSVADSIAYLTTLIRKCLKKRSAANASIRADAEQLAAAIQQSWPAQSGRYAKEGQASDAATFINQLIKLDDPMVLNHFLAENVSAGAYAAQDNGVLLVALEFLPAARAVELLTNIITHQSEAHLAGCANLLQQAVKILGGAPLHPAAIALMDALPLDNTSYRSWQNCTQDSVDQVVEILPALEAIESTLAERTLQLCLDHPERYDIDSVLIPAALRLHQQVETEDLASVQLLCQRMISHLHQRTAESLAPPQNWQRDNKLSCRCPTCTDLAQFLQDPVHQTWQFRAAQDARSHVEMVIDRYHGDLQCRTDKHGRPYTLVCTKNKATYDRRVKQRQQDLSQLAQLESDR